MIGGTAPIGILMLQTRFPRIPGDIGHPETWPFPVLYRVVPGASIASALGPDLQTLLPPFIEAGRALVAEGAGAITTSCGFLGPLQRPLASALGVPVAASPLSQVAWVNALLPEGRRAGILTIAASRLTPAHLASAGVPDGTPIGSTEGGTEFTRAILEDRTELDVASARADHVAASRALVGAHPDLGAIVLECTNMAPYAADIRAATGLPVHSIVTLVHWLRAGIVPPVFPSQMRV